MGQVLQAGVGQAPARQAAIARRDPEGGARRHDQQGVRVVDPCDRDRRADDRRRATTTSSSPAAWSRCRTRRTCCRRRASATGSGTARCSTTWSSTASRPRSTGCTWCSRPPPSRASSGSSREDQDEWALRSQERAAAAQDAGRFDDELVPVGDVTADESVRRDTTLEKLAALEAASSTRRGRRRPATRRASTTAPRASSSAPRSGRAARGIEPLARIVGHAYVADEFAYLARTPAAAAEQGAPCGRARHDDVARVEINEAFASVAKNSTRMLGADEEHRERQRRRRRARAPDRRLRRPDRRRRSFTSCDATAAASGWRRSAPAAGRATRCCSRSRRRCGTVAGGVLAALVLAPAALALDCPNMPLEERLAAADAAFVGRSSRAAAAARRRAGSTGSSSTSG